MVAVIDSNLKYFSTKLNNTGSLCSWPRWNISTTGERREGEEAKFARLPSTGGGSRYHGKPAGSATVVLFK